MHDAVENVDIKTQQRRMMSLSYYSKKCSEYGVVIISYTTNYKSLCDNNFDIFIDGTCTFKCCSKYFLHMSNIHFL